MFLLMKIKEMVEVDIGEVIYDSQLVNYINSGLAIIENNNIPVPEVDFTEEEAGKVYKKLSDLNLLLDWLHLYVITRFDTEISETTFKHIKDEMNERLYMLKAMYDYDN